MFQATLRQEDIAEAYARAGIPVQSGKALCDLIVPLEASGAGGVGSTDVGDAGRPGRDRAGEGRPAPPNP